MKRFRFLLPVKTALCFGAIGGLVSPLLLPASAATLLGGAGSTSVTACGYAVETVPSKSEAILGRQMSALEAMQSAQQANEKTSCAVEATPPAKRVDAPSIIVNETLIAEALANMSAKHVERFPEIPTGPVFAAYITPLPPKPVAFARADVAPVASKPEPAPARSRNIERTVKTPFTGKPDIFGTVALKVSRTPLDRKWNATRNVREATIARTALIRAGGTIGAKHRENNIRAVNRWVNANVRYVEDRELYGTADHWASAGNTLKSGRGDCEDYAIAKMQLLKASGIDPADMFLVIASDLVRRADHALLVVRVGNDMLVLDNETDRVLNAEDVRDYRPIMSYSAGGKWLHGYAAKPARTQLASLAVGR